jgi:hypothetical protein
MANDFYLSSFRGAFHNCGLVKVVDRSSQTLLAKPLVENRSPTLEPPLQPKRWSTTDRRSSPQTKPTPDGQRPTVGHRPLQHLLDPAMRDRHRFNLQGSDRNPNISPPIGKAARIALSRRPRSLAKHFLRRIGYTGQVLIVQAIAPAAEPQNLTKQLHANT